MGVALVLGLLLATVDVGGEGTCTAPTDVQQRLADLLPATGAAPGDQHHARLIRSENGVHVDLLGDGGQRLAARDLAASEGCSDLAAAIAVVIAAWEADLDPRVSTRVKLPRPEARSRPTTLVVQASAPPARPPSFDLGLALIASLTGGQVAPGARVRGWVAPTGWHTGLGVTASAVTSRSEAVGERADAARWNRIAFGAGPETRLKLARTIMAVHAQALAALLRVEGVGLATTASDSTAQFGAGLGVHAGWPWGNATPWIGADLLFWPGHDRLAITGVTAQGELPRAELQLAVGLSLGRFP
jgi:hypothetical protein